MSASNLVNRLGPKLRAVKWVRAASVASALVLATTGPALSAPIGLRLYDGPAPGSQAWKYDRILLQSAHGPMVVDVQNPTLNVYLPARDKANRAGIVLLPGGGLRFLALDRQVKDIVASFNARGIAVVVLEYRTLQTDPAIFSLGPPPGVRNVPILPPPLPHITIEHANANPAPNDEALNTVLRVAVADGQTALRMLREHSAQWNIDPSRIGMLGISAGGGVAVGTIVADERGATPGFFISIYGPSLQDVTVPADAPPIFLATEADHGPVTDGLLALFSMWKQAGKSAELHAYDVPVFSMPVSLWAPRCFDWMEQHGFLSRNSRTRTSNSTRR